MLGSLNPDQIERVLYSQIVGRIGCHADNKTYVVPVTYAYDGKHIYCHSADGLKIAMMRKNPHVCFEVDHLDDMANWKSVIAWGTYEELKGEEQEEAMKYLVTRLTPRELSETGELPNKFPEDINKHSLIVYRILLTEKTGRFEERAREDIRIHSILG